MTWLNPWAFAGLLALAVPILVHLLTRRRTRVLAFPTLRFMAPSRLLPVRTLRPSDLWLLVLRCAIVAAAVTALAQPQLRTGTREGAAAAVLARVIVLDTSASMRRPSMDGGIAVSAARAAAGRAAAEAAVGITVESATPAAELRGAAEWLRRQPGRREILVVSDFQERTLDARAIGEVPSDIGLGFTRVPVDTAPTAFTERRGGLESVISATFTDESTSATWSFRATADPAVLPIVALVAEDEAGTAAALLAAAGSFITPARDTARSIAVVFPRHEQRAELERTAGPSNQAWMGDVAAATVTRAGVADVDSRERLLIFADVEPGTVEAAALMVAAGNALSEEVPAAEQDPATIDDAQLDAWRRAPASVVIPGDDGGASDGRWLWLLVLALLAIEMLVRRPRTVAREAVTEEVAHERVA